MQHDAERTTPAPGAGHQSTAAPTREFAFEVTERGVSLRVAVQVFAAGPPEVREAEEVGAEAGYGHGV
ncbi:MAG: hypothetical protein AB7H88_12145 [Vicinamibacterales bacterium]